MVNILEKYLKELNNDLDKLLSKYETIIIFNKIDDIKTGLLKFKEPPKGKKAFLFILPKEEILHFHTIGMKFPIIISFFNSKKEIIYTNKFNPEIQDIDSKKPAKYVVEIPI